MLNDPTHCWHVLGRILSLAFHVGHMQICIRYEDSLSLTSMPKSVANRLVAFFSNVVRSKRSDEREERGRDLVDESKRRRQ